MVKHPAQAPSASYLMTAPNIISSLYTNSYTQKKRHTPPATSSNYLSLQTPWCISTCFSMGASFVLNAATTPNTNVTHHANQLAALITVLARATSHTYLPVSLVLIHHVIASTNSRLQNRRERKREENTYHAKANPSTQKNTQRNKTTKPEQHGQALLPQHRPLNCRLVDKVSVL